MRVYDLSQLSMKFERHLDAEIVDFQILGDDYCKAAFLCADRSICLHAKFGAYYRTRIPKAGRDLAYAPFTAGAAQRDLPGFMQMFAAQASQGFTSRPGGTSDFYARRNCGWEPP